jgi:hypothetical protein
MCSYRLLFSVLLLVKTPTAWGCKCVTAYKEFTRAAHTSTLLFSGKLVRVTGDQTQQGYYGGPVKRYQFVPDKIWRGAPNDTITLTASPSNCAAELSSGQRYIIYTNPGQKLTICQRIVSSGIEAESARLDQLFTRRRYH